MDPLSLTANIIAVLNAAQALIRDLEKLGRFLNAEEQLLQVLNEVSDFQTVMVIVQDTANRLHELHLDDAFALRLNNLIGEANCVISEIFRSLKRCSRGQEVSLASLPDISRYAWLGEMAKIGKFGRDLRQRREGISSLLTIVSADLSSRVKEYEETCSERLKVLERNVSAIGPQLDKMKATAEERRFRNLLAESSVSKSRNSFPFRRDSYLDHLGQRMPSLRVEATVYRQNSCNPRCLCRCHKTYVAKTPTLTQKIIGLLFIGYSNTPMNRTPCNERLCRQQRSSSFKVNYYFPSWFLYRMVAFHHFWNPDDGHQISVRTPRTVSPSADVFLVVDHGTLESLQHLFSQGLASPFDIDANDGESLLQRAVKKGRTGFCEFLLHHHADPQVEDMYGDSPLDLIWSQYLMTDHETPNFHALRRLFSSRLDASSDLQKRNFTVLHQIVLRLNPLDLESVLQTSTADIDARCSNGTTPLHWAVMRSQTEDIRLLLKYGADVTIADNKKMTPLHRACGVPSTEVLSLILAALSSSSLTNPAATLMPLANGDRPPLLYAIANQLPRIARTLLAHATPTAATAMIDFRSANYSWGAFLASIQYNSHACLALFLSRGCWTDAVDILGLNALHLAAVCGDARTIAILRDAAKGGRLAGCAVGARDSYGYTPLEDFDVVRRRYVAEDDEAFLTSRGCFLELLDAVGGDLGGNGAGKASAVSEVGEGDDSEGTSDEFFDVISVDEDG